MLKVIITESRFTPEFVQDNIATDNYSIAVDCARRSFRQSIGRWPDTDASVRVRPGTMAKYLK